MKFNEESTTTKRNPSNRFLARFVHYSRTGMFQKINKGIEKIQWPKHFTKDEKDLIKGLCERWLAGHRGRLTLRSLLLSKKKATPNLGSRSLILDSQMVTSDIFAFFGAFLICSDPA